MTREKGQGKYLRRIIGNEKGDPQIGITSDARGTVVLNFEEECSWIAMPPHVAIDFAKKILEKAGATKVEISFEDKKISTKEN
jgi:hypothetical protein